MFVQDSVKGQAQIPPGGALPAGGGGAVQPTDGAKGLAVPVESGQTYLGRGTAKSCRRGRALSLVLGVA